MRLINLRDHRGIGNYLCHCRYVVSFLLDSTVGLLVIYIGLKIAQCIVIKKGNESLLFGEYGN